MHLSPYMSTHLLWFRFDYPKYRTASHCALFSSHSLWLTYSPVLMQTQVLLQLNATGETVIYYFLFTLFGNNEYL